MGSNTNPFDQYVWDTTIYLKEYPELEEIVESQSGTDLIIEKLTDFVVELRKELLALREE